MRNLIEATDSNVTDYFSLFVNRLSYTLQTRFSSPEKGRHFYYRPKDKKTEEFLTLTKETVRRHLEGAVTVGLYSTNPQTQRCKWVAIDADYPEAVDDLLRLQLELKSDGIEAAFEQSRRGGHLWIFGESPLLARDCRIYISHLAQRLRMPVKGAEKVGIEIFPKQDTVTEAFFGNAIRGPLGIHRTSGARYWFYYAGCTLNEQLEYLRNLPKLSEARLSTIVAALPPPPEAAPIEAPRHRSQSARPSREFQILDHITARKLRRGPNFYTRCPSCERAGKDRAGDNLSIRISDPRFYKCWAGCTKNEIRVALGRPIRTKSVS